MSVTPDNLWILMTSNVIGIVTMLAATVGICAAMVRARVPAWVIAAMLIGTLLTVADPVLVALGILSIIDVAILRTVAGLLIASACLSFGFGRWGRPS